MKISAVHFCSCCREHTWFIFFRGTSTVLQPSTVCFLHTNMNMYIASQRTPSDLYCSELSSAGCCYFQKLLHAKQDDLDLLQNLRNSRKYPSWSLWGTRKDLDRWGQTTSCCLYYRCQFPTLLRGPNQQIKLRPIYSVYLCVCVCVQLLHNHSLYCMW